jgi:uncharacterized membrane protein YecN with MAPEG domain
MTLPLRCLLGYAAWTMLLILAILAARSLEILSGKKKMNEFPGGVQHGGDMYWRLYRAHANTVENLPLAAVVILTGTMMHVATPMFERLPQIALGARVVQSIVHVSSGSVAAVMVRFTAFATQYVCFAWMIVEILRTT